MRYINAKELKELQEYHKQRGSNHEAEMYKEEYEQLQTQMNRN